MEVSLKAPVLNAAESYAIDKYTIQEKKVHSMLLMGWAGYSIFTHLINDKKFSKIKDIHFLLGTGNNTGDGYVLAYHILQQFKKSIFFWKVNSPKSTDAIYFYNLCKDKVTQDTSLENFPKHLKTIKKNSMIIDAVLGIGLSKELPVYLNHIFKIINTKKKLYKVAIDIPSGIFSNGDSFTHIPFKADITYSLGHYKIGQLIEPGIFYVGKLYICPIGHQSKINNHRYVLPKLSSLKPIRKINAHKYKNGVLYIIGGSSGMEGASILAGKTFLQLGGGLCKIYSTSPFIKKKINKYPELMIHLYPNIQEIEQEYLDLLQKKKITHLLIGIGLAEKLSRGFWEVILQQNINLILDGSILNTLYPLINLFKKHVLHSLILLPHFKEAHFLLGNEKNSIYNLQQLALNIATKYKASIYLKGAGGILVTYHDKNLREVYVQSKNFQLSVGGTGDILSGIVGNMLCRYNYIEKALMKSIQFYLAFSKKSINKKSIFKILKKIKKDLLIPSYFISNIS